MRPRSVVGIVVLLAAAAAVLAVLLIPGPAAASSDQIAMFEDDGHLLADPAGTLHTLRELGVETIRMSVRWPVLAPRASSRRRPRINAADPASYPAGKWAPYDAVVRDAQSVGIQVEFVLTGPAPRWALGGGIPPGGAYDEWKPSPREYGQFVQAVATRYSGSYHPQGSSSPLPRVSFWEIWNEPNYGQDLAPQTVDKSRVSSSPRLYRGLLDAAWAAFQRTDHGSDTILIGSLSPRGFNGPPTRRFPQGLPGYFSTTKPLQFIRTLYCVDSAYRKLRGGAAAAVGCPTTSSGSQQFPHAHPALFQASGFGMHPYPFNLPPNRADSSDPDVVEFSQLGRLGHALDRLQRLYGSARHPRIYNTEFGYITDPPNRTLHYGSHFVSPQTAAFYINWAEYLSWRNHRIASYMQYLLYDPFTVQSGFSTGLLTATGQIKPAFYSYRMPIFLPRTTIRHGKSLEVWGCVRPAHFAQLDTGRTQSAQIQFRSGSREAFRTIATVPIHSPRGYFDVHQVFPSSGTVRLAWSYPTGQVIYSRVVGITVR